MSGYAANSEIPELYREKAAVALWSTRGLVLITAALLVFGLTMLYSTSYGAVGIKFFRNQLVWCAIGGFFGMLAYYAGCRKLAHWSPWMILASLVLLVVAFFSPEINGAHRWIKVPLPGFPFNLQPSELAKLALVFFTAGYCNDNPRTFILLFHRRGLLEYGLIVGPVLAAILAGRDFGTTSLACVTVFAMLLAAGLYLRYIILPLGFFSGAIYLFKLFDPVRWSRVISFLEPETYQSGIGYQLWFGMLAVGSGGWSGLGFMGSRMKEKYLPEAHTDFIMAIAGEELGFIGMILLVFIPYILFGICGYRISLNARDRLGMLTAFGLTTMLLCQAFINVAVILGAVPTKGMPAPFVSYGGSNLTMCLVAVGVLLSIAAESANPDYNAGFWERVEEMKHMVFKYFTRGKK